MPDAQRLKIAALLDTAHKSVSDALGEIYKLHRETAIYFDSSSQELRSILDSLERIGNQYDAEAEG